MMLIASLIFTMSACGKKEEKAAAEVAYVKIEKPFTKDFSNKLSLPATLKAKEEASVNPNVAAMVEAVYVQIGDKVSQGQVVAELDNQVQQRTYEKAKIGLENTGKTYNRMKTLYEEGAISQSECEAIKASYDTVFEDYNLAKLNLSYTKITAPMSGVISEKKLEVGQMAAPGVEAFRIVNLSQLVAESGVSENDITKVKYGQSVNIVLESGAVYQGKIDAISPVTDQMTSTYPVKVTISNSDGKLKVGMFADIEIIFGVNKGGIAIKNTSLINEDGIFYVYLENKGKAEKKKVEIGIQEKEDTEILSGLSLEDKVISVGQDAIKDGDKVKVIKEKE